MNREEFKQMLINEAGWTEEAAEQEAASVYDDPAPGDAQDCDGDMWL